MKWSFQIGTVKGIDIKVHITFFLIVIWGAFGYGDGRGLQGLIYGAVLTLLVFGIVLLHELGHSLAALQFGIKVRDITLLPFGGLARLERLPQKPIQELIVAAAGPAVNVVLAAMLFPLAWLLVDGNLFHLLSLSLSEPSLVGITRFLFLVNVSLLIFNLIPAFPLDGGRIFRALLAMVLDFQTATRIAVWVGQGFAFLLGVYGIFSGSWVMAVIALFIFTAGGAEGKAVVVKNILDRISVRQVLSRINTVLQPNFTMIEVASLAMHSSQINYPVMLGDALIGVIRQRDIRRALERGDKWTTVAEVMRRDIPSLGMDDSLTAVQDQLIQANSPVGAVYEDHHFMGLISFEDIERAFRTTRVRGKTASSVI